MARVPPAQAPPGVVLGEQPDERADRLGGILRHQQVLPVNHLEPVGRVGRGDGGEPPGERVQELHPRAGAADAQIEGRARATVRGLVVDHLAQELDSWGPGSEGDQRGGSSGPREQEACLRDLASERWERHLEEPREPGDVRWPREGPQEEQVRLGDQLEWWAIQERRQRDVGEQANPPRRDA
jgi:hypothetical protein